MTEPADTYVDSSGVLCYAVERLQLTRSPDGSVVMRPTGEIIGKPVHHDTDDVELVTGQPHRGETDVELRPIDKSIYGAPVSQQRGE